MPKKINLEADGWEELPEDHYLVNAVPFNPRVSSDYSGFEELDAIIFDALYSGKPIRKEAAKRRTIRRVTRNLCFAYRHSTSLEVSMDRNNYTARGRNPEHIDSYEDMFSIFQLLCKSWGLNKHTGNTYSGNATYFWLNDDNDLTKLYRRFLEGSPDIFRYLDHPELIVLKDSNKREIGLSKKIRNSSFIKQESARLKTYNDLISKVEISFQSYDSQYSLNWNQLKPKLYNQGVIINEVTNYIQIRLLQDDSTYLTTIPPCHMQRISDFFSGTLMTARDLFPILRLVETMKEPQLNQLQRKFNNGSLEHGGRFAWSPIQNLPKKLRRLITLDGKPTVEHDFSAFHPNMIYHLSNLDAPQNPYLYAKDDPLRDLAKFLFNCLVNAATDQQALFSVCQSLENDPKRKPLDRALFESDFRTEEVGWGEMKIRYHSLRRLYDKLLEYHAPVKNFFGSEAGVRLMRLESDMASDILWHFSRKGIPAIPLHDSFIVPETYSLELKEVMRKTYAQKFGREIEVK